MKTQFERAEPHHATRDEIGTVQVTIILRRTKDEPRAYNNVTKSFTVKEAKVTEIYKSLESWLFDRGLK